MNKKFYVLMFLLLLPFAGAYADFTEGKEYKKIDEQTTDSGDKIEILEFFWYGCPHCFQFEPHLQQWRKNIPANVEFKRIPVVFHPSWKVHGRMYYALETMGQIESLHSEIFDALHVEKTKLNTEAAVTKFVKSLGVDEKKFTEAYNSFAVDSLLRKAIKKTEDYKITGVPTVGINGRYITSGPMAGTYENMIRVMDYLIKQEKAAQ